MKEKHLIIQKKLKTALNIPAANCRYCNNLNIVDLRCGKYDNMDNLKSFPYDSEQLCWEPRYDRVQHRDFSKFQTTIMSVLYPETFEENRKKYRGQGAIATFIITIIGFLITSYI